MTNTAAGVGQLLDHWAEAELRGDVTTLRAMLGDDFVGIGPHGFQIDKARWLDRYMSGSLVNTGFDVTEPTVREYGPVAVVNGVQNQTATYAGEPFPGRFRMTLVAVRRGRGWEIVSLQLSPMADQ
ncbi:nuclear transport factor 2 family protein [Saccharomonospora saliphila]|uniref:nuclear transport factor 2 family protein n=1 Tax=Saccharomonospora saliphila TaxID=369829 RepID=UPI0012FC82EA|nr:nuclear transport factor 2 family protein [Saccharomonospora saliphila]